MKIFCFFEVRSLALFIISLFASLQLNAQRSYYTQSGYTSLTIKLSGDYPETVDISNAHSSNPLSSDKPSKFQSINDSTFEISFFTFGPTAVYFNFNNQYLSSVLLPNQSDVLCIHYTDVTSYDMNYQGHFKEFFDNSHLLPNLIRNSFDFGLGPVPEKTGAAATFKSAREFRDARLRHIREMIAELTKDVESAAFREVYSIGIEDFFKAYLPDYYAAVQKYNSAIGLDSLDALLHIPERDISYYDDIIDDKYTDTTSLISSSYYRFLSSISKDSLLNLPVISDAGPDVYRNRLKELFGRIFQTDDNLFYDMMVANAYVGQIADGQLLSSQQKYDVRRYFKNKAISNYILHQNDANAQLYNNIPTTRKYYFPFERQKDSVISDIVSRYAGKVIVMDFWATLVRALYRRI
ncbi:hypothetical protein SAMN05660226_00135 [Parapedobacter luteus]|uniref:Uncharacterized protein n=1 Tax=Parapedobacter luteus TaxID=623280 RepID=A0A1T4ZVM6_9SPHI|nr:hypothetical protein [Parapedobacter luteus]SKB26529.1 hypothetical protein SAMN05660226_00135 [Parapedobacter luteus]